MTDPFDEILVDLGVGAVPEALPVRQLALEEPRGDPFLTDAFAQLDKRKKDRARKRR